MEEYLAGNKLYTAGDAAGAAESYTQALGRALLEDLLQVKVRLNRAQCFLRTEQYSAAVADCTHVINTINCSTELNISTGDHNMELLQLRMKAFMRRAQAQESLGNYQKALLDVETVLASDPPPTIRKAAVIFRSKLRSFVIVDHEVSLSEGRPNMMVTNQQALRLGFIQQPPVRISLGSAELVRLCITNELGLWDRSLLMHGGGIDVQPCVQCRLKVVSTAPSEEQLSSIQGMFALQMRPASSTNSCSMCIGEDGKFDAFVTVTLSANTNASILDLSQVLLMLEFTLDRPLPASGEVVPVLSLPARVQGQRPSGNDSCTGTGRHVTPVEAGSASADSTSTYERVACLCEEVHATCVRQINVALNTSNETTHNASTGSTDPTGSFPVYALESPGYLGIAGKVWDSMYVLLQYLSQQAGGEMVRGKRVVELGCGTGLAGISLCTMEPLSVVLTDMPEVVSLISANVLMNSVLVPDPHIRAVLRDRYRAAAYTWGDRLLLSQTDTPVPGTAAAASGHPYFDLILASDVVYYPEGYAPLIATLCDLLTAPDPGAAHPLNASNASNASEDQESVLESHVPVVADAHGGEGPVCILAHRHRHPEDKNFFDALYAAPQLLVRKLDFRADHTGQAGSVQALNDVLLFEIKRR